MPMNLKTRFTRGAALLREDVVTPTHHHSAADDTLMVEIDGVARPMSPCEADGYVTEFYDLPELTDVDHVDGGPRGIKRRHILGGAAAGFGALLAGSALPRYSFATPAAGSGRPHLLVCVFLRGGFDGLSAVVPVNDRAYYAARPGIAVRAEHTFGLDANWGMNTNMAPLQELWQAGDLAVIQGSGTPDVSRSHFVDQATVERAAPANVRSGWLGRHLQTVSAQTGTLRGVTVGASSVMSLTTQALDTLAVSSIESFDLRTYMTEQTKVSVKAMIEEMYGGAGGAVQEQADAIFGSIATLQKVRQAVPAPGAQAGYPDSDFGRNLAEVARLAKAGVGMEVACVDLEGWDMHKALGSAANAQDDFSKRSRDFAAALAAFRRDLGDRWADTTIVTMSEFGRRVGENGSGGLDHGQGNTMFVAGGGVRGGRVYGSVPSLAGSNLPLGDVPISLDYRQALSEIVAKRLGNGAKVAEVFPGFTPGAALGVV